jgi:hypothetical protein
LAIQRYRCQGCGKTFIDAPKFSEALKEQAIDRYFDAEASYRSVGRELGLKPHTIFAWVEALGAQCKSFAEVASELRPHWGGYLLADGKAIHIRGVKYALCLTADATTQDIPLAGLFRHEDFAAWQRVLHLTKRLPYPVKGLVLDEDPALWAAAHKVFPTFPKQLCVRHVVGSLNHWLRYFYDGPRTLVEPFYALCHRLCYAGSREHAAVLRQEWQRQRSAFLYHGLGKAVRNFEAKFPHLWVHFAHPGMPRTSNVIEGIIRQLFRKIDDTDGFQSVGTAWRMLQLLIMRYRFHRFSCSRIHGHNGLSPLNLAGIPTNAISWIRFAQRTENS